MVYANRLKSESKPPRGLFVIGTDTEIGKTYVSCLLVRHLVKLGHRVGVYKPVASGIVEGDPTDAELLRSATEIDWPTERVCPQLYASPLAPPIAARAERRQVDKNLLVEGARWWFDQCDILIVEGVGGSLSPIANDWTVLDLALRIKLPLLLVAANRLGVVNQVLLALEAAATRKLPVTAVVLNSLPNFLSDTSRQTNQQLLAEFAPDISLIEIDCGAEKWPGPFSF